MTRQIYAFAGRRFSGKSTAAKALVDAGFRDVKFADPLKNMLRAFYASCGVGEAETERKIEGDLKEVECEWLCGKTPRYAMQVLGTEWRDLIDTNLWTRIFIRRVESGAVGDRIVCSDFRFPHEAEALKEVGATTILIIRPDQDGNDDSFGKHISEASVDTLVTDQTLINNASVEELREAVQALTKLDQSLQDRLVVAEAVDSFNETAWAALTGLDYYIEKS